MFNYHQVLAWIFFLGDFIKCYIYYMKWRRLKNAYLVYKRLAGCLIPTVTEGRGTACLWRRVYFSPPFRLNTSHATTYVFKIFHRGLIILWLWFSHFKNRCCLSFFVCSKKRSVSSWKKKIYASIAEVIIKEIRFRTG